MQEKEETTSVHAGPATANGPGLSVCRQGAVAPNNLAIGRWVCLYLLAARRLCRLMAMQSTVSSHTASLLWHPSLAAARSAREHPPNNKRHMHSRSARQPAGRLPGAVPPCSRPPGNNNFGALMYVHVLQVGEVGRKRKRSGHAVPCCLPVTLSHP